MTRIKTLGLALVAVFAMSAVVASAASANFTTTTDTSTLTLSGGLQVFTTESGAKVKCTSVSGHIAGVGTAQADLTVEPKYAGCTLTEGAVTVNAEVDPMGCTFTITTDGIIHVLCSGENVITVKAFLAGAFQQCFDVHAQTPTTPTIDFTNQLDPATSKWDFTIKSTVSGITYERTGPCKKVNKQENETNNAHYEGEITVTCDTAAGQAIDCTKTTF
jgi:hypothetical protein